MEAIADTTLGPFIGLTLGLFGLCAYLAGQGIAQSWKPMWFVLLAGFGIAVGDRFLQFALFSAVLFSIKGYIIHGIVLSAYAFVGFRINQVTMMVRQYPWLYEQAGPFGWRSKG